MSKKQCCCIDVCPWCDHDHYAINYTGRGAPYDYPDLQTSAQPNWSHVGTVTTELPSIGHPMTLFRAGPPGTTLLTPPFPGGSPGGGVPPPPPDCFTEVTPTILPVGNASSPCTSNPLGVINLLRTPIDNLELESTLWGNALYYGDIQPCWFNGLNMTNIKQTIGQTGSTAANQITDEDIFFNFTFELKIEKLVAGSYQTVIDIKKTGPGLNLRPHPDACRSYNVNDHAQWSLRTECTAFADAFNDEGEPLPCFRDFAKMPRGPWPYRFQRKLVFAAGNTCCFNSSGEGYTVTDVLKAQKDASYIGTIGECGTLIEENILCCTLVPSTCPPISDECCPSYPYLDRNQLCDRLDIIEGTPYGWEDCPAICPKMSNYDNVGERHFFGWINKFNRYTTPEWDFYETIPSATGYTGPTQYSSSSNKLSLHVIVPTKFAEFCDSAGSGPDANGQGLGFGEWCFGMDYEAPDAIAALENAGYVWSKGREDDGIWIHKTPTSALRVLFTLDHADLGQGKVWRVFRDWDVFVNQKVKTFGSDKFKITIKQKVEEIQFSSLGCDCPSGYTVNDDGELIPREDACDQHYHESYFGTLIPDEPELPCWQSTYDGPFTPGEYVQTNNFGARISFSERGPLAFQAILESDNTGCQVCSKPVNTPPPISCDNTFNSRTNYGQSDALTTGQLFIINGPNTTRNFEIFHPDFGSWPDAAPGGIPSFLTECWVGAVGDGCLPQPIGGLNAPNYGAAKTILQQYGTRYNGAIADIPWAGGKLGSVPTMRYRNVYNSVQASPTARLLVDYSFPNTGTFPWGTYEMLYGSYKCIWSGRGDCPLGNNSPEFRYGNQFFGVYIDPWPEQTRLGNCKINCQICGARDNTTIIIGSCAGSGTGTGPGVITWSNGSVPSPGDPCPCEVGENPPGSNPENYGPFLVPYDICAINLSRPDGYGESDFWYDCNPASPGGARGGDFGWYCYYPELPDVVTTYMGLESDRFYFSNDTQVGTRSGIGDINCAATCMCTSSQSNNNSSCRYTVTDPNTGGEFQYCDFCLGSGNGVWAGFFRNSFLSWRKYMCHKRADGELIDPNFLASFYWSCAGNGIGCPDNTNNISDCSLAFAKRGPCELASGDNSGNASYPAVICDKRNFIPEFQPSYRIEFRAFDLDVLTQMCSWDTTYDANPARDFLPVNQKRSHIIITPKGLYPV